MNEAIYFRKPLKYDKEIPVFSELDDYIINYEAIANDHLDHFYKSGANPFIDQEHIDSVEEQTSNFVKHHCTGVNMVLDVGVALGDLISSIDADKKFGVDVSIDYLAHAKGRGIEVAMAKLEELPYRGEQFDLVTCTDVLEHVFDYMRCIAQLGRVVKPGGVVILRVPYKENLDVYREVEQPYDFVHVRGFDLSALRLHFESLLGFEYLGHELSRSAFRGWKNSVFEDLFLNREHFDEWSAQKDQFLDARVRDLVHPSQFAFDEIMNGISTNTPEVFSNATKMLTRPLEICVAFRRPLESSLFTNSPLGRHYSAILDESASAVVATTGIELKQTSGDDRSSTLVSQIYKVKSKQASLSTAVEELKQMTSTLIETTSSISMELAAQKDKRMKILNRVYNWLKKN